MTPRPTEYQENAWELLNSAQSRLDYIISRKDMPYYELYDKQVEYAHDLEKWMYIVSRLKKWYAKIYLQQVKEMVEYLGIEQTDYKDSTDECVTVAITNF